VNSEMHLEAVIERVWRCTWKPKLRVLGDILGGHDRSRLEEYFEAVDLEAIDLEAIDLKSVNLEAVNLEAVNLEVVDREACVMEAET